MVGVKEKKRRGTRIRIRVFKKAFLNYQASDIIVENGGKPQNIEITAMEHIPEMEL